MGRIIISNSITLDGVMQSPGFDGEDPEGGFRHGGWIAPYWDEVAAEITFEDLNNAEAFLLGRKTYDIWSQYWPNAPEEENEVAKYMNRLKKYVVSNSLTDPTWEHTTVLSGEIVPKIQRIKSQSEKDILVGGSGELSKVLIENDLVDVYELMITPLILGEGKKMFREGIPVQKLHLVEKQVTGTGVVVLKYEVKE